MTASCDVIAIGNAIVDSIYKCDDRFLAAIGLTKGEMRLISSASGLDRISSQLRGGIEIAGGSAANTAVGIASLGGRATFIGKVANDDLGRIFGHDLRGAGVNFTADHSKAAVNATSRSLVLVTPDHRRSMITYLGCSTEISDAQIDSQMIGAAKILLLEGYLFDSPQTHIVARRAAMFARASGKRVALTLADPECVRRHRAEFSSLITSSVDVLFANENEISALFESRNLDDIVRFAGQMVSTTVVTRGDKGSVVVSKGAAMQCPAEVVRKCVDLTGAGDLYVAGFLYGLSHNMDQRKAARLGSFAAAEIICQIGARPEAQLENLARMRGLFE